MKRLLFAGALALAVLPAFAQDASSDFDALAGGSSDEAAPISWGSLKWSGTQEAAARLGVAEGPTRQGGFVDGTLAAEYKLGDFKAVGKAVGRNGEFFPGETALFYSPGSFRFGLGWQEFSWGVADANNPTDTLNARDFRYGANADRLVNPAATVTWYPADWVSLEAVYEPWKETTKFPADFAANLRSKFNTYSTVVNTVDDAKDGSQPVYAARANFFLPGVDLSVSYVYDRDAYYTPVVTLKNVGVWVPGQIDLVHKRIQRLGLNAKTTIDRFGVWFEGAYNITEDPTSSDLAVRDNKLGWTTGFDFNFGPASAYYANLQYTGVWIPGFNSTHLATPSTELADKTFATNYFNRALVDSIGAESEEWLHGATYNLKFPLGDSGVTPSLSGALLLPVGYDSYDRTRLLSAFFKPEIDYVPTDGLHLLLGADLAYGWIKKAGSSDITLDTTNDKLGTYTPQNNVYVKVQYQWNGSLGN